MGLGVWTRDKDGGHSPVHHILPLASFGELQFPPIMHSLPITEGSWCLKSDLGEVDAGYFIAPEAFYVDNDVASVWAAS